MIDILRVNLREDGGATPVFQRVARLSLDNSLFGDFFSYVVLTDDLVALSARAGPLIWNWKTDAWVLIKDATSPVCLSPYINLIATRSLPLR